MSEIILRNGKKIGDYCKPYIIAEMNSSHRGDLNMAMQMVDAAKKAGCDCVKFQSWSTESLYSTSYYNENRMAKKLVNKFAISSTQLKELADYCKERNIDFSSTPYSKEEVDFLVDVCGAPFVKISSMEINNIHYLDYIAHKQVPVILSTGMASYDEVAKAVNTISAAGNNQICILHCVTKYPAEADIINLNNMLELRADCKMYPIGYSDHTIGHEVACASVALGAAVIEKHFTLDRNAIGMDNQMATEPEEMNALVEACNNVYRAMGSRKREFSEAELNQKKLMRRSVVATKLLEEGHIICEGDLDAKRPGTGIPADEMDSLIGRRIIEKVEADCLIPISSVR